MPKARPYNLVLLSAERSNLNVRQNEKRTRALQATLEALEFDYQEAEGQYEGKEECSFAVKLYAPIEEDLEKLKHIAFLIYQQDSILVVDTQDKASLLYKNGSEHDLGNWVEIPGSRHDEDWTRIGLRTFTVTD